jgi:hypothetical protein
MRTTTGKHLVEIHGITIRHSGRDDADDILRLAQLDSTRAPSGEVLLAEAGGELVAAVPLAGGRPIADPFRPTAAIVELLQLAVRDAKKRPASRTARYLPLRLGGSLWHRTSTARQN